jgi:hypothetical protein
MEPLVLRKLTLLSSIAVLMLASCTDQSNAKSSVQPGAIAAHPSSPEAISPTVEKTPTTQVQPSDLAQSRAIASTAATNLLNEEQKAQLAQLGVEVVLPTYLPPGFQLAQFEAHRKDSPDPTDYTYYTVSYKGPNNTCIEAGNGYQNTSLSANQERSLSTSVGTFDIQSGTYRRTSITRRWATLPKGDQVIFTGGKLSYEEETCNPIETAEFDQVLQSATAIAPETAAQPSTPSTGNLLSPEQVTQLTQLPIPIVAPTYLPKGYRLVRAEGGSDKYANGEDDAGYAIDYQGEDNTCFTIYSSKDGPRRLPQIGQVESAVGTINMYEATYEGRSSIQSFIPVKGNPMMLSPVSHLNPATGNFEPCKALDRTEYERILKSVELVK